MEYYVVKPPYKNIVEYCIEHKIAMMLSYYSDKKTAYDNFLKPRKERMEKGLENGKLFMDSGAFTAWTQGATIDVDEYCNYINENGKYVDYFGQLDTIPKVGCSLEEADFAAKSTLENYFLMVSKVKYPEKVVFTFHVGEPIKYLEEALQWGAKNRDKMKMIAIGGMVKKTANDKNSVISRAFDAVKKYYPEVKVHLFGCTSKQYFLDFPATSGDSSNYIMSATKGGVWTPGGQFQFGEKQDKNHYLRQRQDVKDAIDKYLAEIDMPAEKLLEHAKHRLLANIKYIEREFYINKISNESRLVVRRLF